MTLREAAEDLKPLFFGSKPASKVQSRKLGPEQAMKPANFIQTIDLQMQVE